MSEILHILVSVGDRFGQNSSKIKKTIYSTISFETFFCKHVKWHKTNTNCKKKHILIERNYVKTQNIQK